MKFPQEGYSAELCQTLLHRFASADYPVTVERKGGGVHWNCSVGRGLICCQVHCFSLPRDRGPQFYSIYKRGGEPVAYSRVSSMKDAIEALESWLSGEDLESLYQQYPFVDQEKRALLGIANQLKNLRPALAEFANFELKCRHGDICNLRVEANERAIEVSFWGEKEFPDAKFSWDDCQLFQFPVNDEEKLAKITNQWLCDNAMPSALRAEHPLLDIGELADYYERGAPIEGEFVLSWKSIIEFYESGEPRNARITAFLEMLCEAGFNRTLRAGQSMWTLVLSRSRRHGLREDQPSIMIRFFDTSMRISYRPFSYDPGESILNSPIEMTGEVETLLKKLERAEVD